MAERQENQRSTEKVLDAGELSQEHKQLRAESEQLHRLQRNLEERTETAYEKKLAAALGIDLARLREEVMKERGEEEEKIYQRYKKLVERASALGANEARMFQDKLRLALEKGGLSRLLHKHYHNPLYA